MSETKQVLMNGRDNVVIEFHTASAVTEESISVGQFWEPVILWLADKFPTWKFSGSHLRGAGAVGTEQFVPWRWNITAKGEWLGKLTRDYYGNKPCYAIENERIANKCERGYSKKTVKSENARKLVLKNFRPKDLKELVNEAHSLIEGQLLRAGHESLSDWRRPYIEMMEFLSEYMMNKFDELSKEAIRMGMPPTKLPRIQDAWETMRIKQGVTECHNQKDGAVVLIHGNTYAVQSDKGQFFTCESATLPASLKRKVGMLKLLENDNYLINVGYRRDENKFYVCNFTEAD